MTQLLIDIRDFAYHAPGSKKNYRPRLVCLLAFYYVGALILIARGVEYIALSSITHIHVFALFLIEIAIALSLISSIIYVSWRSFNAIEMIPAPDEIPLAEYCRKRRIVVGVMAIGVLFFIGSLSIPITPAQKTAFVERFSQITDSWRARTDPNQIDSNK